MAEKTPRRRKSESSGGDRRSTNPNADPNDILAGVSMRGLGQQMSARKRRNYEVRTRNIDPAIMEVALELAQNDRRRLEFNDDGSVTVKNNPP